MRWYTPPRDLSRLRLPRGTRYGDENERCETWCHRDTQETQERGALHLEQHKEWCPTRSIYAAVAIQASIAGDTRAWIVGFTDGFVQCTLRSAS
jgi:hypothetical protein